MDQPLRVPGYDVLAPLGRGASASVWRGRRHADGRTVALKVLRPAGGDVAETLREAGLLAKLRHAHLIHLYDVLPLPDPVTGRPAAVVLVTQFASGGSLAQVLARRRMLSPGELVTALQPVAQALAQLHGQGVVHGDLSTGNILFLRDGMPMLADLGAGRVVGETGRDTHGTGALEGMVAPEVVEGFDPTRESDVYQLGAIACTCLTGAAPGPGYARIDLDEVAPDLPAGLRGLVRAALAPQPEDRPDAEEFALALMAAAVPEPIEVAPDSDADHGLTQRLRQQARDDLAAGGGGSGGGHGEPGAHRPERVGAHPGSGSAWGWGRWVLVATMVAVVLLGAGVLATWVAPGVLPWGSQDQGASVAAPAPSGAATRAGHAPAVQTQPRVEDDEATTALEGDAASGEVTPAPPPVTDEQVGMVLQELVDLRGVAWEGRDAAALTRVMAPDSPALAADRSQLESARSQRVVYPDVTFRVEAATVVEHTAQQVTVDATISRAPLRALDGDGHELISAAMQTDRVRIVLVRADADADADDARAEGWLLWSWNTPTGSS